MADQVNISEDIKEALANNDLASAAAKVQEYIEKQNNSPLNIAITGECGSGKSSFVNAFRGIENESEGAAPTGCVETTTEVKPYPHPNYPNVTLWDLPGIGTTKFPADKYLKLVEFEKFDFFIIISDTRFRENDGKLAQEIQKMGKKFYFVRSKIDNDLRGEKAGESGPKAEETLTKIRQYCIQSLQEQGFEAPQVFLMSSFMLHLYDFHLLEQTLEEELPAHKKNALLFAIPNISLGIIQRKKKAFQKQIVFYAIASSAVAAVPVPGLSLAVDVGMLVIVVITYVSGFGLDLKSLERLAATTGIPLDDLRSVTSSQLTATVITKDLILKVLSRLTYTVALMAAEEGSRLIPFIGIPLAASLSFISTYKALKFLLHLIADDAQRVFKKALGLNTSV